MRNTIKSLLAVLTLSATATTSFSADIGLPDPNYPGGRATVHAIKAIAEEVLGLEVEAVATASLDKAAKADKPWVGYCYGPHQNSALYELVILEEPKHDPSKFKMVQPDADAGWFEKSSVSSAYAETNVHIAYNAKLSERQPTLAKLLENVRFDSDLISKWSYEIAVNKPEPADVAKEWVKANMGTITGWMK